MADYSLREVFKQFGKKIFGSCVNSCVSESQNLPLAASQGKVLQEQITQLNSNKVSHEQLIPGGTSFNKVIISGFYRIDGNIKDYSDTPNDDSISYSQMIVSKSGDTAVQMIFPYNHSNYFFMRTGFGIGKNGTHWNDWQKYSSDTYSNIIRANISTESPLDEVSFYFSDGIDGLYLVVAIDLDDTSNTDNRGFIAIMDVRKGISYRHILQSNIIAMPGHSNVIILFKGATNYLCSSIRLVRY